MADIVTDANQKIVEQQKRIAAHAELTTQKEELGHLARELGSLPKDVQVTLRLSSASKGTDRHWTLPIESAEKLVAFVEHEQDRVDTALEKISV